MEEKICKICGEAFIPKHHAQKYCSPECSKKAERQSAKKYKRKRKIKEVRICPVCGKEISSTLEYYKYCSLDCYKQDIPRKERQNEYFKRKAERLANNIE